MSDDIPQDQVEAVAKVLCPPDMNAVCAPQPGFPCSACRREAIAAIRAVSPLIAAVERERCAALVEDFPWQLPLCDSYEANVATDDAACSVVTQIVAAIRSVKGAVT